MLFSGFFCLSPTSCPNKRRGKSQKGPVTYCPLYLDFGVYKKVLRKPPFCRKETQMVLAGFI